MNTSGSYPSWEGRWSRVGMANGLNPVFASQPTCWWPFGCRGRPAVRRRRRSPGLAVAADALLAERAVDHAALTAGHSRRGILMPVNAAAGAPRGPGRARASSVRVGVPSATHAHDRRDESSGAVAGFSVGSCRRGRNGAAGAGGPRASSRNDLRPRRIVRGSDVSGSCRADRGEGLLQRHGEVTSLPAAPIPQPAGWV
jgi:hypothetical protein